MFSNGPDPSLFEKRTCKSGGSMEKRSDEKAFVTKLIDCAGEAGETKVRLDFSRDFGYISDQKHEKLLEKYEQVSRMLYGMMDKADKFCG
jgi:four helix bundle protein